MASRDDVERFVQSNRDIRRLAVRDLNGLWATVDTSDGIRARRAVEEFLPELVDRYGQVAATVAADWYEELRDQAAVPGRFSAALADLPDQDAIRANGRWAVGPLFSERPDAAAAGARLTQVLDRMALQSGRDTVARSVELDPADARWARVPQGSETCAFCLMLASRGDVYRTRESAGDGTFYHADCDCVPTPMWEGDSLPDGYDPDGLYERYQQAASEAGSGRTKQVLSKLRELEDIH